MAAPTVTAMASGADRFMSEARALTNLIGNGVATVVVARWEGALDTARMRQHLDREAEADDPEAVLVDHELDVEAAQGLAPRRSPA
jgi:aerobic C4-dicarboxylate transport protein